jgi:protein-S-isoprenylcysteine O-methyltransferase Ste14
MFHDAKLRLQTADPRPVSAVSAGVGFAGLAGVVAWTLIAKQRGLDGPWSALLNLVACGLPMVAWSLLVDRVHRNASTGIDWANPKPLRETWEVSAYKLAGLWATWGLLAIVYATLRFYWQGGYAFAMWCFVHGAPFLFAASIPYVLWIDRRLTEPRDGAWALGRLLAGHGAPDPEAIYAHLRSWAVKGFFLAFMLAIVPGNFGTVIRMDWGAALTDPIRLAQLLISFSFLVDVAFATVGYMLTMRPLDSHIRSANPFAAAWTAALICYPPFVLMAPGGPLDYHPGNYGDQSWLFWLDGRPWAMTALSLALVALTAVYAWATVAFGLRFSNLTHRGILTHGPYAWSRHPAYLSKNLFWWLATLPFFATTGGSDAVRATVLMGVVSGIYYWRAKTEERHLGQDPAYQAYDAWMRRNAPVPRFFGWVRARLGAQKLSSS